VASHVLVSTRRLVDGALVVEASGEVDFGNAGKLRQALVEMVGRVRPPRVVVDLSRVTFLDSVGISALVAGYRAAAGLGAGFTVRDPSPFVLRQLAITGLAPLFGCAAAAGS
jgi:anti-sigma B factor antagonist